MPWFVTSKEENGATKHRFITDCRVLNQYFCPKQLKLDNLNQILPFLRKNWWGVKVDLKDAYFHLRLAESLQPFLRMAVGEELWEFQSACFGISTLPHTFMQLMKVLEKIWRKKGFLVFIYLDDILLLAPTEKQARSQVAVLVDTLLSAGFKINVKKSILEPTQEVVHLGMEINLKEGRLEVPSYKLKNIRKELEKLLKAQFSTCRKMASILGQVRSYLVALPFLRLVTDELAKFSNMHLSEGWDFKISIPEKLKTQLRELNELLVPGLWRPFFTEVHRELHSDSSTHAWGVGPSTGNYIQEF